MVKNKRIQLLPFSRKVRSFGKKFLHYLLLNMIHRPTHAKFASSRLHKQENYRETQPVFTQIEHPLFRAVVNVFRERRKHDFKVLSKPYFTWD